MDERYRPRDRLLPLKKKGGNNLKDAYEYYQQMCTTSSSLDVEMVGIALPCTITATTMATMTKMIINKRYDPNGKI